MASGRSGFLVRADLPGVDGEPVGTAIYESPYAAGPLTSSLGSILALSLALSVLVSTFVGLYIARVIGGSIAQLGEHMREQADAAVTGGELTGLRVDSRLPIEFRKLTESFNTMLRRFDEHESALALAIENAVEAKASLDIAFTQSTEGKVLLYDGKIQLINPMAISHFDLNAERLEGSPLSETLSSTQLVDEFEEPLDAFGLLNRVLVGTTTIGVTSPRRTTRWLRITSAGSDTREGTLLLSTHDITEERRADSLRTEIVSLVSHDLRAPLTVITGYLDLLSNDPEPAVRSKAIESARRSAVRMEDLLEDLLSATRAEEMFAPAEMEPIDLTELSKDVASSLSHTSRHTITFKGLPAIAVLGEERRLRQVVVNLVSNALKYSPLDTLVTVTVTTKDGLAMVAVEDEGDGVAQDDREIIFERFTRLTTDGERRPGIGLGLYIVRR
ncbi:MAG: ATP-binding protein, partial [Actinomycetota bacterium]|nr:ATP-binding protein [Actinomycetota bacterium]